MSDITERTAGWVDGKAPSATALADLISGFPRVRLCRDITGHENWGDWIIAEQDRFLICKALRELDQKRIT